MPTGFRIHPSAGLVGPVVFKRPVEPIFVVFVLFVTNDVSQGHSKSAADQGVPQMGMMRSDLSSESRAPQGADGRTGLGIVGATPSRSPRSGKPQIYSKQLDNS